MLTKRTNILFDQEIWDFLVVLSKKEKTSVGELIRDAVYYHYLNPDHEIKTQREKAHKLVLAFRKKIKTSFSSKEIVSFIHDGRKYS